MLTDSVRTVLDGKRLPVFPHEHGLKPQYVKNYREILAFFWKKRPLTVKFLQFCSESLHRYTDRRVVFKFREIGEIMRCLPDKKQNFTSFILSFIFV